jgi:hypothetical protein
MSATEEKKSEKKRLRTQDEILDAIVDYTKEHPQKDNESIKKQCLLKPDDRFLNPADYVYASSSLSFYRGGSYSEKEIVHKKTYARFLRKVANEDKEIYLGEMNGKHSEVSETWDRLNDCTITGEGDPLEFSLAAAATGLQLPFACGPISMGLEQLGDDVNRIEDSEEDDDDEEPSEKTPVPEEGPAAAA